MSTQRVTALCGGVGGSKLVSGLYRSLPPGHLGVVVNTADDLDLYGLRVCPDLDTVTYTLAGIAGPFGWGIRDDTAHVREMLGRYGEPTWFQIGDRDMATHIVRTARLRAGESLTAVTAHITSSLGIHATVRPMTDDRVETQLRIRDTWTEFQEYFVHGQHQEAVDEVRYRGIERASGENAVQLLRQADIIVIVNSNPVLSILPILAVPGMRAALRTTTAVRCAVSPIIGHDAVSGPAGQLMALVGQPATAYGVASLYREDIDVMVIDTADRDQVGAIEDLGLRVLCTNTIMRTDTERQALAADILSFVTARS